MDACVLVKMTDGWVGLLLLLLLLEKKEMS